MEKTSSLKLDRVLQLYFSLARGEVLTKQELTRRFQVTERSVQRDLSTLRCFLAEQNMGQDIVYDKASHGYRMENLSPTGLNNNEILAVCKILLESRSMRKEEMFPILDRLLSCCVPEQNKKVIQALIANEKYHYLEPHHGKNILDGLWEIGQAIQNHQMMELQYQRVKEPTLVTRRVEPVGLMFSEYYFYLTAFLRDVDRSKDFENADDLFPTIYRIDRIQSFKVLDERFYLPYKCRFEEGEFRKRVQFMYGGKLETIQFRYKGPSLEAVLDRLPTAEVIATDNDGWTIRAEVFGKGIDMWLRSQGNFVEVLP